MLERREGENGVVAYRSPLLESLGLPHLFTTRRIDARPERDLGALDAGARGRVAAAAGLPGAPLASLRQVHGAQVVLLRDGELPLADTEGDGLVSERSDVLVGVFVADCVPVLIARSDGRRVAAVHAGWRGIVAGVVPRALDLLGDGRKAAAIGPCLSRAHFEVGPEVTAAFERAGLCLAIDRAPGRRDHIDLRLAVEIQLRAGGIKLIDSNELCTYAGRDDFYSFRRDVTHGGRGRTGRLGAWIAARPERRAR
jgi:YfiH family protein